MAKSRNNSNKSAFVPVPSFKTKINPQNKGDGFKPFSKGVESLDSTPNYKNKSKTNVTANPQTSNQRKSPTGGRVGGKFDRPENPVTKGFPIWAPTPTDGPSWQTKEGSSPGYNIEGQDTPTTYDEYRDTTLFKNWNDNDPGVPKPNDYDARNTIKNYTKCMEIDLKSCLLDLDYKSEWKVIYNILNRSVLRNTNASAGAMNIITEDKVQNYLHQVSKLYSLLYEYEVITTWNPDTIDQLNAGLRHLGSQAASTNYLDQRRIMREALRPHVLPGKMMKYIRWIHEYKRMNHQNETVVTCFRSPTTISLMDSLYTGSPTGAQTWKDTTKDLVDAVNDLNPSIASLLLDKCDSIKFEPVENWMGMAFRGTTFDAEFNNIYNNRTWCEQDSPTDNKKLFPQPVNGSAIAAFNTVEPFGLSLANLSYQLDAKSAALPLETSGPSVVSTSDTTTSDSMWNHFMVYFESNDWKFRQVLNSWEHGDNSNFTVDSDLKGIFIPRGDTAEDFYPSKENIGMDKRRSFSLLFQ